MVKGNTENSTSVFSPITKCLTPVGRTRGRATTTILSCCSFVSFRREGELNKKAKNACNWCMQQNSALNTHSEKLQSILKAKENVEKVNEARQAAEENVPMSEPMEEGPQVWRNWCHH